MSARAPFTKPMSKIALNVRELERQCFSDVNASKRRGSFARPPSVTSMHTPLHLAQTQSASASCRDDEREREDTIHLHKVWPARTVRRTRESGARARLEQAGTLCWRRCVTLGPFKALFLAKKGARFTTRTKSEILKGAVPAVSTLVRARRSIALTLSFTCAAPSLPAFLIHLFIGWVSRA